MAFVLNRQITDFVLFVLDMGLRVFALIPITTISMLYEIFIICWIAALLFILALMFINNEMSDDYSIGVLVSVTLFITQILSNIIALGESYFTGSKTKQIRERLEHIDRIFRLKLQYTLDQGSVRRVVAQEMLWIHSILLVDTMVTTYTHEKTKIFTVLYWYSFLPCHASKLRCTQLVMFVICMNERLNVIRKVILEMVKANSNGCAYKGHGLMALASEEDTERVASLKLAYSQLNKIVNLLNESFGWSLVSMFTSYFIDFITNCYWIFMAKFTSAPAEIYVLNGGPIVSLALQITVMCWHCQKSEIYSRCIGCSICKLSKPMGNKRYNDLVNEFALQALHQSFSVTAKDFFVLNLDLLRGMAGAIVTYLVILIQFMFTERSGSKITVPNSSLADPLVVTKNQTIGGT